MTLTTHVKFVNRAWAKDLSVWLEQEDFRLLGAFVSKQLEVDYGTCLQFWLISRVEGDFIGNGYKILKKKQIVSEFDNF